MSPWMRNGNIRDYAIQNPEVDRFKLVGFSLSAIGTWLTLPSWLMYAEVSSTCTPKISSTVISKGYATAQFFFR